MKCDLCKHEGNGRNKLCDDCGDMIKRLLTIEERLNPTVGSFVESSESGSNKSIAASGRR